MSTVRARDGVPLKVNGGFQVLTFFRFDDKIRQKPFMARWSSGLRLRPLTPATAVRIRYGSPLVFHAVAWCWHCICSVQYSSLAQSVEHAAVNRRVVGSSPTGGAKTRLAAKLFDGKPRSFRT